MLVFIDTSPLCGGFLFECRSPLAQHFQPLYHIILLSMSHLITVVLVLIIVGVLLWLINRYIPMASPIKTILNVVVIIAVIIWLLKTFGLFSGINL